MDHPQGKFSLLIVLVMGWVISPILNFLAFIPEITLDDVQKVMAILASAVVIFFTIRTYYRNNKKK